MMEAFAVPVKYLPDGRLFIPQSLVEDDPYIALFIERHPDYWHHDMKLDGFVADPFPERKT
jgi:hypothetical protein